jgi:predicted nucleic acid-binding protein
MVKVFVDTNILVYTLDERDRLKQKKAQGIFSDTASANTLVVSTQVLQEFYSVATTKLKVDKLIVKSVLRNFANSEIVQIDMGLIEQAIDLNILEQISFWDSLIVAAAEYAGCEEILSEDLQNGRSLRGIKIVNPFKR